MNSNNRLFVVSGPCVIEDYNLLQTVCSELKEITDRLGIDFIFKASFDKANRSSIDSFRGPGLEKGLKMLQKIKQQFEVKILSDIHSVEMIQSAAEVLDILQIPAFLARQTDFYVECAKYNKVINVKKGQFMSPYEMENAVTKYKNSLSETKNWQDKIWVTERGTFFGYGNLVVDFRSIQIIKEMKVTYVYDATHSLQLPSAKGSYSGGQREFLVNLAKAQISAGADGLFIESHPNVEQALSDKHTQYPLQKMNGLLTQLKKLYDFHKEGQEI